MKFKILAVFAIIFLMAFNAFAADTTDTAVNYVEGDTWIIYYGPATFGAAGGTDNAYTQAFYIADCNLQYGGIYCYATEAGTEDVNPILEYSADDDASNATFGWATTYADLDATGTTIKSDTLGINAGAQDGFKFSKWARIKFDGQAGNENSLVMNWYVYLTKKPGAPTRGVAGAKSAN